MDVLRGFYEKQLEKVNYPDAYLFEKVIKKRDKEFVKWIEVLKINEFDKKSIIFFEKLSVKKNRSL